MLSVVLSTWFLLLLAVSYRVYRVNPPPPPYKINRLHRLFLVLSGWLLVVVGVMSEMVPQIDTLPNIFISGMTVVENSPPT